ncbi:uncharacterized protein LOC126752972 [Bactrocera neohumeralis]|uniref:uncharacterized protein LOC126752972 n=1 Tax=Bactrocera neohumeralis TaxID=98809 RepID=UPI0021653F0C|nr:uncharacterized protein LOC126752972 [Bactrocera neohumeralis]
MPIYSFGLYIVFKNIAHLKQVYAKPEDSQSNKFDKIGTVVSKILGDDFEKLKDDSIHSCWNSDLLKDLYPATTKLQKMSKNYERMYKPYIQNVIMSAFLNTILHDDVYRVFARNFSAYMASGNEGIPIVHKIKSLQYGSHLFSLDDWGKLYNSSSMISELLPYYARTAQSYKRKSRVCNHIEDFFDEICLSEWSTIDEAEILDDCIDTCTILDRKFIHIVLAGSEGYPDKNFCEYKAFNQTWLDLVISKHAEYKTRRDEEGDENEELAHSIVLPAITLPKHVINSLQEDPRVNYKVKKIN